MGNLMFAVWRVDDGYVCSLAMNTQTMGYQACIKELGMPVDHFYRTSMGSIPKTWRGKPMTEVKIVYSNHHPISGLAREACVQKDPAAVALGRKGGAAKSAAKTEAARANGRKGGRPKKAKNGG